MKAVTCDRCQAPNATGWTVAINEAEDPAIFPWTYSGDLCDDCVEALKATLVQFKLTKDEQ